MKNEKKNKNKLIFVCPRLGLELDIDAYKKIYIDAHRWKIQKQELYDIFCIIGEDAPFKSRLPKSMDFSNALYTIDIGQNDLSFGFMSSDPQSVRSTIPDILSQFSQGLQVNNLAFLSCSYFICISTLFG